MDDHYKGQYLVVWFHIHHGLRYITENTDGNLKAQAIILIFKKLYYYFLSLPLVGW